VSGAAIRPLTASTTPNVAGIIKSRQPALVCHGAVIRQNLSKDVMPNDDGSADAGSAMLRRDLDRRAVTSDDL
jgi:hypothetical protein